MKISEYDFMSNPFASDVFINVILDGKVVEIQNEFGTMVFKGDPFSAKTFLYRLLANIGEEEQLTRKVTIKLKYTNASAFIDSFRQELSSLGMKYSTTNIRVHVVLAHIDYMN